MTVDPAIAAGRLPSQRTQLSEALLVGGPASFPETSRRLRIPATQRIVKIEHRGGYEHFERDDDTAGDSAVVYRWESRTEIAE